MKRDEERGKLTVEWGSMKRLFTYCDKKVNRFLPMICGPDIPIPLFRIRPSRYLPDNTAAYYSRGKGKEPPKIVLSAAHCLKPKPIARYIAHEMIHHWECCGAQGAKNLAYPKSLKERLAPLVSQADWRAEHSDKFIAKACEVALLTEFPVVELLIADILHCSQTKSGSPT